MNLRILMYIMRTEFAGGGTKMKKHIIFALILTLINGYTAAAETTAAAVWDFGREMIIAERTTKGQWHQQYIGSDVMLTDSGFLGECASFPHSSTEKPILRFRRGLIRRHSTTT